MDKALWLTAGVIGAGVFLFLAHGKGVDRERRWLSLGLMVAAANYVFFALLHAEPKWVMIELLGVGVFTLFVVLAYRFSVYWLALGWLLHLGWDIGLHHFGTGQGVAPEWYVWVCLSFDAVIALAIVLLARQAATRSVPSTANP